MLRSFSLCILLTLCAVSFAFAAKIDSTEINGNWTGTMQGPNGDFQLVFTFHMVNSDSLTGSVQGPMGSPMSITNGKIDSSGFTFDVSFNQMTIHHICTITSDSTISMKANGMQGNEMDLTLKRQPKEKEKATGNK